MLLLFRTILVTTTVLSSNLRHNQSDYVLDNTYGLSSLSLFTLTRPELTNINFSLC